MEEVGIEEDLIRFAFFFFLVAVLVDLDLDARETPLSSCCWDDRFADDRWGIAGTTIDCVVEGRMD